MEKTPESITTPGKTGITAHEDANAPAYARFLARVPRMIAKSMEVARPLAYASEVGESFRKVFPNLVKPLYALSIGYVLGDIGIKFYQVKHKNFDYKKWYLLDLSLWHLGASIVLPAVVINRYIHTLAYVLGKINVSTKIIKYVPTVTALCLIPFIVHPLDHFTDYAMDNTFRKYVNYKSYDDLHVVSQDNEEKVHH